MNKAQCIKLMRRVARYAVLVKIDAPYPVIEKELKMIAEVQPLLSTDDLIHCLLNFHEFQQEDEKARAEDIQRDQEELDNMSLEELMRLGNDRSDES